VLLVVGYDLSRGATSAQDAWVIPVYVLIGAVIGALAGLAAGEAFRWLRWRWRSRRKMGPGYVMLAFLPPSLCALVILYFGYHTVYRLVPSLFTRPLDADTRQHLCQILDPNANLEACAHQRRYASDYHELVHKCFRSVSDWDSGFQFGKGLCYDQITGDLEAYRVPYRCRRGDPEDPLYAGHPLLTVYDLGGDGAFPVYATSLVVSEICMFATHEFAPLAVLRCNGENRPLRLMPLDPHNLGQIVVGRGFTETVLIATVLSILLVVYFGSRVDREQEQ